MIPHSTSRLRLAVVGPLLLVPALLSALSATWAPCRAQAPPSRPEAPDGDAVVVYLVRHAEKSDDGTNDPPLAIAGQIRVQLLLALLGEVELTDVHTTDYRRTRETARPFAQRAGVEPSLYDARDLETLAARIKAKPGRHLVTGHSNTTPQLVSALGGDPSGEIDEMEYDRLYIVSLLPGRRALTTLLRFGEPYGEGVDVGLRADATTGDRSLREPPG